MCCLSCSERIRFLEQELVAYRAHVQSLKGEIGVHNTRVANESVDRSEWSRFQASLATPATRNATAATSAVLSTPQLLQQQQQQALLAQALASSVQSVQSSTAASVGADLARGDEEDAALRAYMARLDAALTAT